MKKLFIVAAVACSASLFSCGSSDKAAEAAAEPVEEAVVEEVAVAVDSVVADSVVADTVAAAAAAVVAE